MPRWHHFMVFVATLGRKCGLHERYGKHVENVGFLRVWASLGKQKSGRGWATWGARTAKVVSKRGQDGTNRAGQVGLSVRAMDRSANRAHMKQGRRSKSI